MLYKSATPLKLISGVAVWLKKYLEIAASNYSLFTSTHMPLLAAVMLASYMAWHCVAGKK